ncbi:hypothetical protein F4778DRAFT_771738 [Xylariomycetidae sp. FL2044]|nr:hypothetical protein F4778DRAFT_771738 [Xylariomycetidae sp. FL2044]
MAPELTRRNSNFSTPTHHYTMKTSNSRPSMVGGSHSRHSQNGLHTFRSNKSTTPMASPRLPHSVGQPYPPNARLSPSAPSDARSPSPNYFGLSMDQHAESRNSANGPLDHWSPPSSSVKSFAAAIPASMPLDANPEFEAFRRQVDANANSSFSLSGSHFAPSASSFRPKPPRWPTNQSDANSELSISRPQLKSQSTAGSRMDVDTDSLHDSAYVSSESKRNSEASLNPPPSFSNMPRFESPAQSDSAFEPVRRSNLSQVEDRNPRLSLPQNRPDAAGEPSKPRSETVPPYLETDSPRLMMISQLKGMLEKSPETDYLLLDVRVSTQYSQSRIRGAINLCIPSTLLKRATFNLEKLQTTLQTEKDQEKFAQWSEVKHLVIYDASSSETRDAIAAMNMFKKFSNEGFSGKSYLLKGGFHAFADAYPDFIDRQSAADRPGAGSRPAFAPVIGGVMLPSGANNPNPFFSNIRQNMDLADGVGQMDISVPKSMDTNTLPQWLRETAKTSDHGKQVSEKFLNIERGEQSRMREAYSAFNAPTASTKSGTVRLSGVEKGVKNRYKDILPFEHARVRLADREEGACDYINASHVQASRSHKRYIASQGPLPATFEDFWSMIWEQDVRVIVMLTAESEGGQLKCHPYWQSRDFGAIQLKPISEKKVSLDIDKHRSSSSATPSSVNSSPESGRRRANTTTKLESSTPTPQPLKTPSDTPFVIIRKFVLSHGSHPFAPMREITHLHYPSWPDFGAPAQPSHLLALVELANVMQRSALPVDSNAITASVAADPPPTISWFEEPESDTNARPMLVHCSAGCGRTGTFCTVDSVIDMLKRQRLTSLNSSKQKRDTDGDVDMMNPPVSPLSTKGKPFEGFKAASEAGSSNAMDRAEASWVGDSRLDLIEKTVEDFRKQRLSMVQSLRQFVLCYETVVEWVWRIQDKGNNAANSRNGRTRSGSLREAPR